MDHTLSHSTTLLIPDLPQRYNSPTFTLQSNSLDHHHLTHPCQTVHSSHTPMSDGPLISHTHVGRCTHLTHPCRTVHSSHTPMSDGPLISHTHVGRCTHLTHPCQTVHSSHTPMSDGALISHTHVGRCTHLTHPCRTVHSHNCGEVSHNPNTLLYSRLIPSFSRTNDLTCPADVRVPSSQEVSMPGLPCSTVHTTNLTATEPQTPYTYYNKQKPRNT